MRVPGLCGGTAAHQRRGLIGAGVLLVASLSTTSLAGAAAGAGDDRPPPRTPVAHRHYVADHMGSEVPAPTGSPALGTARAVRKKAGVAGTDVGGWQWRILWSHAARLGVRFAVVKATEGTGYVNPYFIEQYTGSAAAGMTRGAYHFALPDTSSGTAQADFFLAHGGGWSADGRTLPPALDIEYDPYGPTCYGLTQPGMVSWLRDFVDEVHQRTGRWPLIYTTLDWWARCTGNSAGFSADPLWIARYNSDPGPLPAGWAVRTIWQYAAAGPFPGDQDLFNGTPAELAALAGAPAPGPAAGNDAVSAALPARIAVRARTTPIPLTITCGEPHTRVTVTLRSAATAHVTATVTLTAPAPTSRFTGTLDVASSAATSFGAQRWTVTTDDPAAHTTRPALLRTRSLLGLRATRRAATVTITGAARVYATTTNRYTPWAGRPVHLQRRTQTGWRTLTTLTTDSRGKLHTVLHLPAGTRLRLTTPATPTTWGAASTHHTP